MTEYSLERLIEILSQDMERYETALFQREEFSRLTLAQIHYLDMISHLGYPTITELAIAMNVSKPTATQTIDKLVQKGYVQRIQSASDGRVRNLHLTPQGAFLASEHDSMHRRYTEIFRQILTGDELGQLEQLLTKVVKQLR